MRWIVVLVLLFSVHTGHAASVQVDCPHHVGLGLPFVVRVVMDQPVETLRVEWTGRTFDIPVRGMNSVHFLLGTDVLKSTPGRQMLRLGPAKRPWAEAVIEVDDRVFPEQRLTVAPGMASPPRSVQDRIAREAAQMRAVLNRVSDVNHLRLPLVRPVPGAVSSAYGLRRFFNNQPRNPHRGLDFRAALGDPIAATGSGRVVLTAEHYYAGRCVCVDHGWGVYSLYMHLDEIAVREGQLVAAGDVLGRVGQTGRVTGPHVHFGLSIVGLAVDPTPLFPTH